MSPKKNTAYTFDVSLVDSANRPQFKASPTIIAGDFKVSIDGGALANPATLPTVSPAAGKNVKIELSAAEMNGNRITVICSDAAGAEWDDVIINLYTTVLTIDDTLVANPAAGGITEAAFTVPAVVAGVQTGILGMVQALYRRFFKKTALNKTAGTIKTYANDGTTVLTTQTATDDGITETQGDAS